MCMVRTYILTDHEKKILEYYLSQGLQLNGFRQLKKLILDLNIGRLREDLELIERFLEKSEA